MGRNTISLYSRAAVEHTMNVMRPGASLRKPQRLESFAQPLLDVPGIDAEQVYMLPTPRRDLLEQLIVNISAKLAQMGAGTAEIGGVPVKTRPMN